MELNDYRIEIDEIDRQIVDLFQRRMRVAEKIAEFKMEQGLPVLDEARETIKLENIALLAEEDMADYCRVLYNEIMKMSRDHQTRLMKAKEGPETDR